MVAALTYIDPQHRSAGRCVPGLISRALGVRERPRNLDISTSWELADAMKAGRATYAGLDVNARTAMMVAAVFDGVRIISEDIGKLPFPVYQRVSDDERQRATTSPFWRLIHDRPNSWQTSQQFRETLTAHALLHGNAFALKNAANGQVRELLPIRPEHVRIEQLDDFELIYHVRMADGVEKRLTRREVFHLPGLSIDGFSGLGLSKQAREAISLAMAMERHAAAQFGSGAQPSGIFKSPAVLSDKAYERLKADLKDLRTDRYGGTLLLEEGTDWMKVGLSNEEAQLLQLWKFVILEIARWLRMPPHKLGDLERATFSNIEHSAIEYVQDTLMSWAKRWEGALNTQVINTNGLYAEIELAGLLRGDMKTQHEALRISVGGPWRTRNEARRLQNLPPLDGLDEVLVPQNIDDGSQAAGKSEDGDVKP